MAFTLLGAVAVGVFCACIAFIATRFLGRDYRFLIPVAGGAGMLGFTIWNDYDWFQRHRDALPETVEVVQTFTGRSPIQPWTYLAAPVVRYQALDRATLEPQAGAPGLVQGVVYLVARYAPTYATRQVFDCGGARHADAPADGSTPAADAWHALEPDDPLLAAACGT